MITNLPMASRSLIAGAIAGVGATSTMAVGRAIAAPAHADAKDYGVKAGAYVDAFMNAISWASADRRLAQAVASDRA